MVELLDTEDLLRLHSDALGKYGGGKRGLLNRGLLEGCLARITSGSQAEEFYPTLFEKAAALLESLIRNHPFVDGNKRTALLAAGTLLELNGWCLSFDKAEAVDLTLGVANKELDLPDLIAWLRKWSVPAPGDFPPRD